MQAAAGIDFEERGRDLPTYAVDTQHFEAEDNQLHLWSITGDATFQAWQQDNGLRIGVNSDGLELDLKAHYTVNVHVTQLFPAIAWNDRLAPRSVGGTTSPPIWRKSR